jgi:hypothetical protein
MTTTEISNEIKRRRTFAIISHADAGKTTLTEKLLLFGGAIQMAGTVKGRKATRHATSDWTRLEQQRGIAVTSSVRFSARARLRDRVPAYTLDPYTCREAPVWEIGCQTNCPRHTPPCRVAEWISPR